MAHRLVQAARRLTEALRSISRSQCATAVAEFSSTLLPRQRRLSAVRSHTGDLARVPGASPRTQVSGLHGGSSPGFAVARRQGPIRGSRTRKRSGRDRISVRMCSAPAMWPAVSSVIALTRRGSGSAGVGERLRISFAKSGMVFMIPFRSRETASAACFEDRYRVRATPCLDCIVLGRSVYTLGWAENSLRSSDSGRLYRSVRGVRIKLDEWRPRGGLVSHFDCSRACGLVPSKEIGGVTWRSRPRKKHNFGSWSRRASTVGDCGGLLPSILVVFVVSQPRES